MREPSPEILNPPIIRIGSPEQMQELGRAIGAALDVAHAPFVIALEGELGAGKTTLVGGILHARGIAGPVRSPTYTLIEPYETGPRPIYHLDLYRLVDPSEIEPLGVRDLLTGAAVLLIEWPCRAATAIPAPDLSIEIDYLPADSAGRQVRLRAHSSFGHKVVRHMVAAIPELRLLST